MGVGQAHSVTNYTRGRSREYQTMRMLRDEGWFCSRSAMSHGPVDVFAAKDGMTLLIQVKSGSARIKKIELEIFKVWAEAFDATAEVWNFRKRGKVERIVVRKREIVVKEANARSPSGALQILPPL